MINDRGGINGRKINFISADDGYSPPKTVEQNIENCDWRRLRLPPMPICFPAKMRLCRLVKQPTSSIGRTADTRCGDALGTAIPLSFTYLVFMPRHLNKKIGVPVGVFVREAYTLPCLLTLPLVATLWMANRFFYPRNLVQLVLETMAASSVYAVGLFWAYRTNRAFHVAKIAGPSPLPSSDETALPVVSVEYQNEA